MNNTNKNINGKPPFENMPKLNKKPPFGNNPPKNGMPPFALNFEIPPLVDVSFVKRSFPDVSYGESQANTYDLFLPDEGEGAFPLIIHIHGGGFGLGDKRDGHVKKLLDCIKNGYAFASINYRLSKEALFPAAVLDCRQALRHIKENATKYHIDANRIGVIGGSAGGNLSAILAMNIPNNEFYKEKTNQTFTPFVKCAIDWFGPTDFAQMDNQAKSNGISFCDHNEGYSAESSYLGAPIMTVDSDIVRKANPIRYINDKMCPILVQHGRVDKLVPFEQSVIFVDAIIKKLGKERVSFVPLDKADHEDPLYESDENMNIVWKFFEEHLK